MVDMLLTFICVMVLALWQMDRMNVLRALERKEQLWNSERKDLLDRIQAPDFNQYASKVIREKKAEQPPEEKPNYEQFVS